MEREEAKALVEKELENCGIGGIFELHENYKGDYFSYKKDQMLEVSVQVSRSEYRDEEINVYLDFEVDDTHYEIAAFKVIPQDIAHLFTQYKKIREMK
jgi:hypothetical protein